MGAMYFSQVGIGRDVSDAFHTAREQAGWEHGHGGYTGTLAEKYDYVVFDLPNGWKSVDLLRTAQLAEYPERLEGRADPVVTKRMDEADRKRYLARRAADKRLLAKALATFGPAGLDRLAAVYADKWGPAGAVQMTGAEAAKVKASMCRKGSHDKVFLFFGSASS